ncbi:MAG: sigma factor-like helix-turn-helix DNA-binding protein [Pseudoflavonifractor sp.]
MKNQAYRMALLFDFYGDMLTARQKEFFDLYYNEDLSLAEIAENYEITRQGVRDVIVRAEGILTELEDKTGIIRRFQKMQTQLEEIEHNADEIVKFNALLNGADSDIDTLCQQIKNTVILMKRE